MELSVTDWKIEIAKARLSELVRLAQCEGPQRITVRGKAAAVVLSPRDYAALAPSEEANWVDRFRGNFLGEIDLTRDDGNSRKFSF